MTMGQRVSQLEAHSATNGHETTQSVEINEGEQSFVEKGPKTTSHMVARANAQLQSTPMIMNWGDRNLVITWLEDNTKSVKLFKISKKSEEFLNGCFTHSVPNATRWTIRDKFGAQNTVRTACPTLDKVTSQPTLRQEIRPSQSSRLYY